MKLCTTPTTSDDKDHLILISPLLKKLKLDETASEESIPSATKLNLYEMIDDGESSLADGNIELNKEKFYEYSKRIQSIGVKGYFNTIKKNLNIKIEKPFTPQELCSAYENISRITYSNTRVAKKFWTDEENIFLVSLVTYFTYLNDEDFNSISESGWAYMATLFPGKSQGQLKAKWQSLLKIAVGKTPWSAKEDELLIQIASEKGSKKPWTEIASELNARSGSKAIRTGKQCRERWINYLDPEINRGFWTTKEDVKLLESFIQLGKKWAEIAKRVGKRTENCVKNRWVSLMKKYKKELGLETLSKSSRGDDKETLEVEQVAKFALEALSGGQRVSNGTTKKSISLNSIQSDKGSKSKHSSDKKPKSRPALSLVIETSSALKENESLTESLNYQQSIASLADEIHNGSSENFDSVASSLSSLEFNPFVLDSAPSQLIAEFSKSNELQPYLPSPNIKKLFENWQQQQQKAPGKSPMNGLFSRSTPTSKPKSIFDFENIPITHDEAATAQPFLQTNSELQVAGNDKDVLMEINERTHGSEALVQTESRRLSDCVEVLMKPSPKEMEEEPILSEEISLISDKIMSLQRIGVKEKGFEAFSESLIGNHNLKFALFDISTKDIFLLANVTKENYEPFIISMLNEENSKNRKP